MFRRLPSYRSTRVSYRSSIGVAVALVLAACAGAGSPSTAAAPAASAERTVQDFLRAVTDSNLTKMAQLWGSAKGPAATTHEPADYERRIVIMQAFLRGAEYRIMSNDPAPEPGQRILQVEVKREHCDKTVPFTVLQTGNTWLVNKVDLSAAGSPGRACDTPAGTQP
jgi:hypothetical protein